MCIRNLTFALTFLVGTSLLSAKPHLPNEITIVGGSAKADDLWLSGLNLSLRQGRPGVLFCLVQRPGHAKEYAYLLVIKGDEQRRTLAKYGGASQVAGAVLNDTHFVDINGSKIDVVYQMQVTLDPKAPTDEKLTINGEKLNLRDGRVLLVDLSGKQPQWRQVVHAMPPVTAAPTTTAEIDSAAGNWVQLLRKTNRVVDEFLRK